MKPINRAPAPPEDLQFLGPAELSGLLGGPACARLSEIVQHDGLRAVIASSFVWDPAFVADLFPSGIPVQIVCPRENSRTNTTTTERSMMYYCSVCHKDHADRRGYRGQRDRRPDPACEGGHLRKFELIHPSFSVDGGIMHAKMLLLDYGRYLRVVITSANLTALDWNSIGEMVWRQDFPVAGAHEPNAFEIELTNFVNALGCDASFISRFSFSAATVQLLCSVPGEHRGDMALNFGHLRLRSLLSGYTWAPKDVAVSTSIEVQVSSVGGSHRNWFCEFLSSALAGKETTSSAPNIAAGETAPVANEGSNDAPDADESPEGDEGLRGAPSDQSSRHRQLGKLDQLRIIFPSEASMRAAVSIVPAFAEVEHYISYFDSSRSMRPYLYEAQQPAERTIIWHSKIIVRTIETRQSNVENAAVDRRCQWAYVGSHNLTAAAWGSLDRDGQTLRVRNYEIGVVFLPSEVSAEGVPTLPTSIPLPSIPSSLRQYAVNDRPWGVAETGDVMEMQGSVAMWKNYGFASPVVILPRKPFESAPPSTQPPATPAATDWSEQVAEHELPSSPQLVTLEAPVGLKPLDGTQKQLMEAGDRAGRVFISAEVVRRCLGIESLEVGGKIRLEARETQKGWDTVWILHYEPPVAEPQRRAAMGRGRGKVNLNSLTEALQEQGVPAIQFKGQPVKRDPRQFPAIYAKLPEGPGFGQGRGRPVRAQTTQ